MKVEVSFPVSASILLLYFRYYPLNYFRLFTKYSSKVLNLDVGAKEGNKGYKFLHLQTVQ